MCITIDFSDEQKGHGHISSPVRTSSTSSSGIDSDLSISDSLDHMFVQFSCECQQCSILDFIQGRNQCSSSKPPQIKILAPDPLYPVNGITSTVIPFSTFKTALECETRVVHTKFCSLLRETFMGLKNTADLEDVKTFILSLLIPPGNEMYSPIFTTSDSCSTLEQIEKIANFDMLWLFLQKNYCSWYNYAIISAIRKEYLLPKDSEEADQQLLNYECLFQRYVQRRCFLYLDELGPQPQDVKTETVTCKIDVSFNEITHEQIKKFKLLFIQCLSPQLNLYNVTLKHVREGCTELVFRAPTQLLLRVITQCSELREYGFIRVTVGGWDYLSKVLAS